MSRGTLKEESNLNSMETECGQSVRDRNTQLFRHALDTVAGRRVILVGRIDGRREDGHIVEVKERRNRLFHCIPLYEKVQLCAYMVLTGTHHAILRERFDSQCKDHAFDFDSTLWDTCLTQLKLFMEEQLLPARMLEKM